MLWIRLEDHFAIATETANGTQSYRLWKTEEYFPRFEMGGLAEERGRQNTYYMNGWFRIILPEYIGRYLFSGT